MTKNDIDLNIVIQEDYEVPSSKYNGRYTKSTLFLLPMLGLNIRDKLINKYLQNTFINDEGITHVFENCLFLLFNIKNLREKEWQQLRIRLRSSQLFVLDYYVGKSDKEHLVMFVMQIPDKWIADYNKFLQGDYSQFSTEYKSLFPAKINSAGGQMVESIVYGAMYKTDALKTLVMKEFNLDRQFVNTMDEIWSLPEDKHEIYRYGTNTK